LDAVLRRAAKQSGLIVDPSASLRLEVEFAEEESSKLVEIVGRLNRDTKESISIKKVKLRRRLVDGAGQERWTTGDRTFAMSPKMFESGAKREIEGRLRGQLQDRLNDHLGALRLPEYFFPTGSVLTVPLTRLTDGE
jgi:hypothetical protein